MMQDNNIPPSSSDMYTAKTRRARISLIWLIPIIVAFIAAYLGWKGWQNNGPDITISFETADGLVSGQTEVKNRAVVLGVVKDIRLSQDLTHVLVTVHMNARFSSVLSDHANFWVVRPRFNGGSITGLDTLLSGAYIAMDPGAPNGKYTTTFKGLEAPPAIQSGYPGHTYTLISSNLGSIGQGAPVFFRDIQAGEVLDYTIPPGGKGPVLIKVFIRDPYDKYLRTDTRFWNVSGLKIGVGAGGLQIQLQSLQALLSGGIAFGLSPQRLSQSAPPAPNYTVFKLFSSKEEADSAGYTERVQLAMYVHSSVQGLAVGNKVTLFGLQIGSVTDIHLLIDKTMHKPMVRVTFEIQPERMFPNENITGLQLQDILKSLISTGLRASVSSESLILGNSIVSLNFVKNAKSEPFSMEGRTLIIPNQAGGVSGIMDSMATVADKIAAMPLTQLGENLNNLLAHADQKLKSPETKKSLIALRQTLQNLNAITKNGKENLPELSAQLQLVLKNANDLLASYGGDTDFHRNLQTMIVQLSDAARSLRFLSSFLTRHPSAIITGR